MFLFRQYTWEVQQGSKWGQLCLGTQSHKFSNLGKKMVKIEKLGNQKA
jgi:hypothetical protein